MRGERRIRVEQEIGSRLEDMNWDSIQKLVKNGIAEAVDIDFKRDPYGGADSDKKELAKDIAAFANTNGGLLLIGIDETGGAATGIESFTNTDETVNKVRQVVASLVAPLPQFETKTIPDPDDESSGVVAIIVQKSAYAPHAVCYNDTLRYPQRHGATTFYLSEAQVAARYKERLSLAEDRQLLASNRMEDLLETLDGSEPWLVMTLVPDVPGTLTINRKNFEAFQSRYMNKFADTPWRGSVSYNQFRTGHRRFRATGQGNDSSVISGGLAKWCALELHSDGSAAFATRVADLNRRSVPGSRPDHVISDEWVASGALVGLFQMGTHCWETGSAGYATLRATLWPVDDDHPTSLGYSRGPFGSDSIGHQIAKVPIASVSTPVGDLAEYSPDLVATAAALVADLAQSFGLAEVGQFSADGQIRINYWRRQVHTMIQNWATEHGIDVTEDTFSGV